MDTRYWTIFEHNVPLYGVSIWSSRIVDPGLMASLITSSRIIIDVTLFFFKMHVFSLKCFFSGNSQQNWTIFEHNVPLGHIWCVYMVLTDSRSGSYDVTDDVITCNHCRNFGAKYLGNEARYRDGFNVQRIGTCLLAIDCTWSR